MLYAIRAYEQIYEGMHEICNYAIINANSQIEAEQNAEEISLEVINDSPQVINDIIDIVRDELYEKYNKELIDKEFEDSFEFQAAIEESINDDVDYEIYLITDTCGKSLEELEEEWQSGLDKNFIEKYCKKMYKY